MFVLLSEVTLVMSVGSGRGRCITIVIIFCGLKDLDGLSCIGSKKMNAGQTAL